MLTKKTTIFAIKYTLLFFVLIQGKAALSKNREEFIIHDTLVIKDTLKFYKNIRKAAYKHKFTKLLYHAIFVDPNPKSYEEKPLSDQQKAEDPNLKYKDKYIREIHVEVHDPFGYSVNDTVRRKINPFQKLGNKYHITTRNVVIRNLLLFKVDDVIDLLKISESERLLRGARYISDARIYVLNAADSTDRVDVKIVVHDRWALDATASGGTDGGHIRLRDRNLIGSGQTYEQYVGYAISSNYYDYRGQYYIANIGRTYISSNLYYKTTRDATETGFSFDRPFYSALAKWAGGVAGTKTWGTYAYTDPTEGGEKKVALHFYNYDTWIAKSVNPGTGKTKNRRVSNLILAIRYVGNRYQERPSFSIDTNKFNVNSSLYLSSIGFSLSKYYTDQYIFRFGANEDVPEGLRVRFLYGLLDKEEVGIRYYTGFEISRGKHIQKIGYLSAYGAYGTYYNKLVANNATLNAGLTYFSDLLRSGRWYYRQFLYLKYVYGVNKPSYEKTTLNPSEMYGFNNGTLLGTSKAILNIEGVTYAPYNLIGFKMAPVAFVGLGVLENEKYKLWKSPVYQAYALGLLIRNENLLNASFEFTFGMYPNLPDNNKNYSKFNPVTSFKLKVRGFDFSRPATVEYE
ncbi:MAG: hypothetical protein ABI315_01175 [Bacteroidia bacterium]